MADFFDKLKKGLNKATTTVGAKSQNMIDVNKLKGEIVTVGRERKTTFENIGEKIYEMHLVGAIEIAQVDELLAKLVALDQKRNDLSAKIEALNTELEDKLSSLDDVEVVDGPVPAPEKEPVETEPVVPIEIVPEVDVQSADSETQETNSEGNVTGEYKA